MSGPLERTIDAILELINSQPRTPSREELARVITEAWQKDDTKRDVEIVQGEVTGEMIFTWQTEWPSACIESAEERVIKDLEAMQSIAGPRPEYCPLAPVRNYTATGPLHQLWFLHWI